MSRPFTKLLQSCVVLALGHGLMGAEARPPEQASAGTCVPQAHVLGTGARDVADASELPSEQREPDDVRCTEALPGLGRLCYVRQRRAFAAAPGQPPSCAIRCLTLRPREPHLLRRVSRTGHPGGLPQSLRPLAAMDSPAACD
ncbi:hypothetical protein [Pyxidicoccus caerfyrddinensis]|uniref:hypothetical protein n=1 Tax=Pyxidicoccus caerfyrddinensis TaxID=2709663 RepID=UPI0013DD20F2|nr:hypothetical protein [Pyxidicoccus caerfyrddinensis]